jgi:hypothetical protein
MAVVGSTYISLAAMAALVGESVEEVYDVCENNNQNKWSFYRGKRIRANASTRLVELVGVSPRRLGDFRGYDENALEPTPFNSGGSTINWGPSGGTTDVVAFVNLQALNVKEIAYYDSQSYDYVQIDLYSSAANRTAGTPIVSRQKFAISYSTISPHVDCSIDKYGITQQVNSPQLITLTGIPTTYSHLYADTYITNSAGTRKITLDTPYSDWDMHQLSNPIIKSTAIQAIPTQPAPAGGSWLGQAFIITNPSSTMAATVDSYSSSSIDWNLRLWCNINDYDFV